MSELSKLRKRLKALRDKTTANGCTEAEALAAAAKYAEILRDHGLSESDIVFDEQARRARHSAKGQKAALWPTIATCTNTAVIVLEGMDQVRVSFVGREPSPEIACYLREVCERAVDHELAQFKASPLYRRKRSLKVKREVSAAFVGTMVRVLNRRLLEIFGPTISAEARKAAQLALRERHAEGALKPVAKLALRPRDAAAALAGVQAAQRTTLAHGVGDTAAPGLIGRGS
jgi:hypothetical protein